MPPLSWCLWTRRPPGPGQRLFLGVDADGTAYFAAPGRLAPHPDARPRTLRETGHLLSVRDRDLLTVGLTLTNWHTTHAYSPATGSATVRRSGGWARIDGRGATSWPRIDPAVIVLVHDRVRGGGGRCLLVHTCNASWRGEAGYRQFSCLAGLVEPGESAEAAMVREVHEEVGVAVSGLRYVISQPWPIPGSLMLAFTAFADPTLPLRVDSAEIAAARWFSRRALGAAFVGAAVDTGDGSTLAVPPAASVACDLMRRWQQELYFSLPYLTYVQPDVVAAGLYHRRAALQNLPPNLERAPHAHRI